MTAPLPPGVTFADLDNPRSPHFDPPDWPFFTSPHIPPPPTTRPPAVADTECYPNFWLWKLRPIGGLTYSYRLFQGQRLDPEAIARIKLLHDAYLTVTFNGKYYDMIMIRAALAGYTPAELKALNDRVIVDRNSGVEPLRPWDCDFLPPWEPADHIDLIQTAPGSGSQKAYGARIHSKRIQDLPYPPDTLLTPEQMSHIDDYCEIDLDVLTDLWRELRAEVQMREIIGARYGLDLRSKSDAQMAEAVLRKRVELATGTRAYKPGDATGQAFRFETPSFITYTLPQLCHVLGLVQESIFRVGVSGHVAPPVQLRDLEVTIGSTTYTMGLGGLHSRDKCLTCVTDANTVLLMADVASYYPNQIINSGKFPPALGPAFVTEYRAILAERLEAKAKRKAMKAAGQTDTPEYRDVEAGDEGGKVMANGTFGKTSERFSYLYGPSLMVQTTLGGQLAILMLIEWLEHYGISVISANTDGVVIRCPRPLEATCRWLVQEWERRANLTMEVDEYMALYARDVSNYFAFRTLDDVKRKGDYAPASLRFKKSPFVEICSDAVEAFITRGVPLESTIRACTDIRKFVNVQVVAGGGIKMWGEGPRKDAQIRRDIEPLLLAKGWLKSPTARGRWQHPAEPQTLDVDALTAYRSCFAPQRPEYMGKVCRWYYGINSPGPIVYKSNGNTVGLSEGAIPCQTLPDVLPLDIDYAWYINYAQRILTEIGFIR